MPRLVHDSLTTEEYNALKKDPTLHVADLRGGGGRAVVAEVEGGPPGYNEAGFASRLLWGWITPLVQKANRAPLEYADLGALPAGSLCSALLPRFDALWEREKEKPKPSLLRVLVALFNGPLAVTGIFNLCINFSQLVVPVLVNFLLRWCTCRGNVGGGGRVTS